MTRLEVLIEVYDKYQKSPNNIGIWLYNQIQEETDFKNGLPLRQNGEIIFSFCEKCGLDWLQQPKQCDCGGISFIVLGSQQGRVWRKKNFSNGYKSRTVP